jgi:hypothetical protein
MQPLTTCVSNQIEFLGRNLASFAASPPRGGVVSQDVLGLIEQYRRLSRECEKLRLEVVRRLQDGAPIEPGPLTAEVREVEQRYLSAKNLTSVLGPDVVAWLKAQVALSVQVQLWIMPARL